jgi:hypothetical protein
MTEDPSTSPTPTKCEPAHWLRLCSNRESGRDPHEWLADLVGGGRRPVYGVDGDQYSPYVHDHPFDPLYSVVIDHLGTVEHVSLSRDDVPDNHRGDGVLERWLADRTDTSPRPLQPAPSREPTRIDTEETILANLIANPEQLNAFRWLPPETFTAELRRAIYTTLRDTDTAGRPLDLDNVIAGAQARITPLTDIEELFRTAPDVAPYLHRLAVTPPDPDAAMTAAAQLHQWDVRQSLSPHAAYYRGNFDRKAVALPPGPQVPNHASNPAARASTQPHPAPPQSRATARPF